VIEALFEIDQGNLIESKREGISLRRKEERRETRMRNTRIKQNNNPITPHLEWDYPLN